MTEATKEQINQFFSRMFEDQMNRHCSECGRPSQQWVDRSLCIFLCITCASLYKKETPNQNTMRSITLQSWTHQELRMVELGGNRKYRQFICHYDMQHLGYADRLHTKAVHYYRLRLIEVGQGREPPLAPDPTVGVQPVSSLGDLTPEELLSKAKEGATKFMDKTMEVGSKAYDTVSDKIKTGELKEDVIKAASSVGGAAKGVWNAIMSKINS